MEPIGWYNTTKDDENTITREQRPWKQIELIALNQVFLSCYPHCHHLDGTGVATWSAFDNGRLFQEIHRNDSHLLSVPEVYWTLGLSIAWRKR